MRLISIVGHRRAGKTTLLAMLARELTRRGKRVAAIRAVPDPLDSLSGGSEAGLVFQEGRLDGFLHAGRETQVLVDRADGTARTADLARRYFADRDLVLAEEGMDEEIPKIEVFRSSAGPAPLAATAANPREWVAVLSDVELPAVSCPVLRFTDTMWLQFLAALVWDRAKPLGA